MELAFGAMASLAPKLGDLLMQEYVVQKGLKPDIESLSKELLMMEAALVDASRVPPEQLSEVEKLWSQQVRELSYDMEDVVDDFVLRVAGGACAADATDANVFKTILGKATAAVKKVKHRHQISDKIKDIKKLSNELAELRSKYTVRGAGADLAATTGIDPRVINLYKRESDLVGIEESRDKVIKILSIGTNEDAHASDQNLKIVSIVGVGGLGKTTLAKTVHDMLKKQFDCSAFISVGRTPSLTRTFENMLEDLDEKYSQVDMSRWNEERFSNELYKFLQHKRYFIVVDDIWDVRSWEVISYALRDSNCRSRIIVTSRNFEVATKAGEVYKLKPLSDENSEKLFYKRIQSHGGESLDGVSGELSSKIIDKCGGIPLAIIAIASLLVERPYEDWSKVYDSIGFGNNGDNTSKILLYSYYDLPSYLKPCLLYVSKFKEDSIVEINSIIWMWIYEGFVHLDEKEKGRSLFAIGQRYFNELVNRSLIQPMDDTYDWWTRYFRIHDIVLDFIRKLSRDENFITVLDSGSEQHTSLDSLRKKKKTGMPCFDNKVRSLTVQNYHVQCLPLDTLDMDVLRSLHIEDSKIENMLPLHRFRVCRVLCLQNCHVPISLKHIGRLLHLKYLGIWSTPVNEIPKEIGDLKSLQTLELIKTGLDELPPAVCSLTQLMCLAAIGFRRLPTDRIGNLTSLEELRLEKVDGRSATENLVVELGKLTRLRAVKIVLEGLEESMHAYLVQSLCILHELQELVLSNFGLPHWGATVWLDCKVPRQLRRLLIEDITFARLPGWINRSYLSCLCFLSLQVVVVEVQDLDNLARLQELRYLKLVSSSWPPGYTIGIDGFRNLRFCNVGTTLKFHMGAMPRLEELQFVVYAGHYCWEENDVALEKFPTKDVIKGLDLGLDSLLSIEEVTVTVDCSGSTAAEVQEVEAMVTLAVENHPNCPTIQMDRECEENIISDELRVARLQQHIENNYSVLNLKDKPDAWFINELRTYRHLRKAIISIDCSGTSKCEVKKVRAAFRHAAEVHPNHPTIHLFRTRTYQMVSESEHPDTELTSLIAEGFQRFPTDKMGNPVFLEKLQLKNVVGRSATDLVVELVKQTRLRVVTIAFSEELEESLQKALVQSLSNLQELQELELSFTRISHQGVAMWEEDWEAPRKLQSLVIADVNFSGLPRWINHSHLPLLCVLSLSVYVFKVHDLDNIGRLPALSNLELVGSSWPPGYTVGMDGFRNLRFCKVGTTLKFHVGTMPRLEELQFVVYAGYWCWENNDLALEQLPTKEVIEDLDLGLHNLLALEEVTVRVDCSGATAAEVQEVEAMVTRAVENHPNHPTIQIYRKWEENILSEEEREKRLQHDIEKYFDVLDWKDEPDAEFISYLRRYRRLQKAVISIDCECSSMCEVDKVEAGFRHAAEDHPNHPAIQLIRTNTDKMVSSSDHPETEETELGNDHDDSPDNLLCKLQHGN